LDQDSSVLGLVQTLAENSVVAMPEPLALGFLQLFQPLAQDLAAAMDLWWDHLMADSLVLGLVQLMVVALVLQM
jgi:hypothetical protein